MKKIFASKLKQLRKNKKFNQTQMAELLGLHLQTISRYERGELTPSLDVLSVIAEKFHVDMNSLISDDESYIAGEPFTPYESKNSLEEMLKRILIEGDEKKVFAVRGLLTVLDPGEKAG